MKVVIAAGGTGGHIYPGIAIAEELLIKDPKNQILFIGSSEGIEGKIVRREGFGIRFIKARGMLRKLSWKAFSAPFITLIGLFQSVAILKEFKPDWIITTGGYLSLPVVLAARILKLPVLLHEQNIFPGITNRFCSRFAKIITLSFEDSLKFLNGQVTGNPVRRRILTKQKIKCSRFTILVLGGSQGSRRINYYIPELIEELKDDQITLIHITGERDFEELAKAKYPFYTLVPYMYNIEEGLRVADLIISRAGATAISEVLACGLPSILIPFPYSAEGHQEANAAYLESNGAARVIAEKDLMELPKIIKELLKNKPALSEMAQAAFRLAKRDAQKRIVDLLYEKN